MSTIRLQLDRSFLPDSSFTYRIALDEERSATTMHLVADYILTDTGLPCILSNSLKAVTMFKWMQKSVV